MRRGKKGKRNSEEEKRGMREI
jgi:hypothetical protein